MTDAQIQTLATHHGVNEELAARAYDAGLSYGDLSRWAMTYGVGIVALLREVLNDHKAGKLTGRRTALTVLGYTIKYGSGVTAFLDELFGKLGLSRE